VASGGKEEPVAIRDGAENWPFSDIKVNHDDARIAVDARQDATCARRRFA
jgi:hypothetical protein